MTGECGRYRTNKSRLESAIFVYGRTEGRKGAILGHLVLNKGDLARHGLNRTDAALPYLDPNSGSAAAHYFQLFTTPTLWRLKPEKPKIVTDFL